MLELFRTEHLDLLDQVVLRKFRLVQNFCVTSIAVISKRNPTLRVSCWIMTCCLILGSHFSARLEQFSTSALLSIQ